jgi:glutamate-1-semialdehyde 2,1-aminomutase
MGHSIWDVDGNVYVDCHLAYGTLIAGHGHPAVMAAVADQLVRDGTTGFGASHEAELTFAQAIADLFASAESVRFVNTGLEATLLALRIARAATGRPRWAKFEGHYHGSHDQVLVSYRPDLDRAGTPASPAAIADSAGLTSNTLRDCVVLPFNDWESTEALIRRHWRELSAIIVEPAQGGYIAPAGSFLEQLSQICRELGIALVFDEVKTGFRLALGGAQEYFGVEADLTALAKILGGGYPLGAVLGRRELMNLLDTSTHQHGTAVFHSGTHNGHPTAIAAGQATLDLLRGTDSYRVLDEARSYLEERVRSAARRLGLTVQIPGIGSAFSVVFSDRPVRSYRDLARSDIARRQRFDLALLESGVFSTRGDRLSLGICHTADVVEEIGSALERALAA